MKAQQFFIPCYFLAVVIVFGLTACDRVMLTAEYRARTMAEAEVEKHLLAPSTARFSSRASKGGKGFTVEGTIDAQNEHGAMVRESFRAEVSEYFKIEYIQVGNVVVQKNRWQTIEERAEQLRAKLQAINDGSYMMATSPILRAQMDPDVESYLEKMKEIDPEKAERVRQRILPR